MIEANNPVLKSWVNVPEGSDFPIQNLPFGIFKIEDSSTRVGVRIGDHVLDLKEVYELGYLDHLPFALIDFENEFLNSLMKKGKQATRDLRNRISHLLNDSKSELKGNSNHIAQVLIPVSKIEMRMPVNIGDYTDFYSSKEHATNIGTMIRDPKNALSPNWLYIPVGYHGRASSVILSGQNIHRPKGQIKPNPEEAPIYDACRLLDFELEMAFITYDGKTLGDSISTGEADDYIFGMCLFNDWSARDIQTWEYVPLGPFLSKNFASSISAWIVTLDALEPFKLDGPVQDPKVLSYLEYEGAKSYDINLEVFLKPENSNESLICNSNHKYLYWNLSQQLAHHTVNGCNVRCGDLMGSGTISGPTPDSYGSMMELSWRGSKPLTLKDGSERKFINDNDTVIMRGYSSKDGVRVGFGEVITKVLPAKQ